jgi:hypothetical protein
MTTYGANGGVVTGQPISPNFGAQNGAAPALGGQVVLPAGMTMLEAMSRGILPRNCSVASVNGVSCGAQNPTPLDDLVSNGAGNQVNIGAAISGSAGNPVGNGAINQQVFVDGTWTLNASLSTGPTPTNQETLTSCPVSCATLASNLSLSGTFQG